MNTKPTYYDLSQSQKILFYSQSFSLYKQINNVFSLMLLNKELDFDALRQAIAIGKDITYDQSEHHQKDRAFWDEECKRPEPFFTHINGSPWLERYRKKKRNPNLRGASCVTLNTKAAHEIIMIPPEQVEQMETFCRENMLPLQTLFMMGLRTALSARNNRQPDISFHNAVARRATQHEKRSGGTRIHVLVIRSILPEECTFLDALIQISDRQSLMFRQFHVELVNTIMDGIENEKITVGELLNKLNH
ncbi:MAG: hypothetical protein VB070_06270 [Clostridiaceae bacterium]|nr:hypothetical protein [Clostridiaceae bacterium]